MPLVTAATWHVTMIDRLRDCLTRLMGQPDWDASLSIWTKDRVRILADLLKQRAALDPPVNTKAAQDNGTEAKSTDAIAGQARRTLGRHDGDDLMQLRADPKLGADATNVVDLLLDVMNAGTDHGSGQRNIYPEHAYTVVSVKFAEGGRGGDAAGDAPGRQGGARQGLTPVSDQKSTVRMRNPHHGNEPDETGDNRWGRGGADNMNPNDGLFNMSLSGFLLSVGNVTSFTAPHSTPPAP